MGTDSRSHSRRFHRSCRLRHRRHYSCAPARRDTKDKQLQSPWRRQHRHRRIPYVLEALGNKPRRTLLLGRLPHKCRRQELLRMARTGRRNHERLLHRHQRHQHRDVGRHSSLACHLPHLSEVEPQLRPVPQLLLQADLQRRGVRQRPRRRLSPRGLARRHKDTYDEGESYALSRQLCRQHGAL